MLSHCTLGLQIGSKRQHFQFFGRSSHFMGIVIKSLEKRKLFRYNDHKIRKEMLLMRIISGQFRGKKIIAPMTRETRPTSDRTRESVFNLLSSYLEKKGMRFEDLTVLDVFAGTGALGLEALSRGCRTGVFLDASRAACQIIQENVDAMHLRDRAKVYCTDIRHIDICKHPFSLIFLDPPYRKGLIENGLAVLLEKKWIAEDALFILELGREETLSLPANFRLLEERIYGISKILLTRKYA